MYLKISVNYYYYCDALCYYFPGHNGCVVLAKKLFLESLRSYSSNSLPKRRSTLITE